MSREIQVRFCEHLGGRFLRVTRLVVLCQSAHEAQQALAEVQGWMQDNELELNMDKTHVGDCLQKGQGFEFLGYRFEAGRRLVRKKSLMKVKEAIRARTRRSCGATLSDIVAALNLVLRGWYAYFKHAIATTFVPIDCFVRRRLRAILRRRDKRPGQGQCFADHRRWPNAYFAELGLFTMTTARRAASQSR